MCVGGFFGRTRGSPLPWCLVLGASLGIWWLSSGEHEVRRYRGAWCLVPRWVFGGFLRANTRFAATVILDSWFLVLRILNPDSTSRFRC